MKVSDDYHFTSNGFYRRNPKRKASEYLTISKVPKEFEEPNKHYWRNGGVMMSLDDWNRYAIENHYKGLRIFERNGTVELRLLR